MLISVLYTGCALLDGQYPFDQGWRDGIVLAMDENTISAPIALDCRERSQGPTVGFVKVRYRLFNGAKRTVIVPVQAGSLPQVGAKVIAQVRNCVDGIAHNEFDRLR